MHQYRHFLILFEHQDSRDQTGLSLLCFIFQNGLGIICLQGRNKQVSDVDFKGYFL